MKAKLIKLEDGYELFTQGFLKGSTNHELIDSLNVEEGNIRYKLSLKNCQVIELGYELDELAKTEYPIGEVWNDEEALIRELAFKKGFQKALEILGNKKFGEFDMRICFYEGKWGDKFESFEPFIQSLQQTEWEVEIETHPREWIKKLDENGCLILKRL